MADAGKARDAVQSELDDLLMVFGDLEEKLGKYKVGDPVVHEFIRAQGKETLHTNTRCH